MFAQLSYDDADCGSIVTPILMDVTANASWKNASLSLAPFVGELTEVPLAFSPVMLMCG